jgi:hypothetical protein
MTSSFDNIKSYINNAKKLPSGVKSKNNVKRGLEDPTLKLKLSFFSYISGLVEPFLRKYQTSKPMIPFLYEDLDKLLRNLLSKFVKKEFTDVRTSILLKLNFSDDKILCSLNKIDVGFGVVKFLKSDKVTEKDKLCHNCMSHGNATVESGFSINKQILVENLKEHTLVCQRQVYDAIYSIGGVTNLQINDKIIKYYMSSHRNYKLFRDEEKKKVKSISKEASDKKKARSELYYLENKKKRNSRRNLNIR